jgi:serine/threonine protein kinase
VRKFIQARNSATRNRNTEADAIDELCVGVSPDSNLVRVLHHGAWSATSGPPLYHIDMELCDTTLEAYLKTHYPVVEVVASQRPNAGGGMEPRLAWQTMKQITNGVAFIHSKKFVHRDIKPANGVHLRPIQLS